MKTNFDVIVIGGGHAGIEAAHAAATLGSRTLLLTLHKNKVASMPCNPSIGGLGKGHIVFEISALGGLMPKLCSDTYLQARMLNTRKGPAVQGLRLQIDKYAYSKKALTALEALEQLTIIEKMAQELVTDVVDGVKKITGVKTKDGTLFTAPSVIVTTGTFMSGVVHIGHTRYKAGRRGEAASYGLSDSIAKEMNVQVERLKTGTPPRLKTSSIKFEQLEQQVNEKLEYLYEFDPIDVTEKIPCYIARTNSNTHKLIHDNLDASALYSGNIKGVGPRYCPSIEDKVGRYPDRHEHHVFIEPEGLDIDEVYPAGLSTSLPLEVQEKYIKSIKGLEDAEISKCGYAIEYDFIQPNNLAHTLETKAVKGLYLAGQLNGTTGYEEAAGQGLVAGINAHLKNNKQEPFILKRTESYIGVMIDDLIMLGADEPYRMFTSRAERRLILRQDNVFLRLMPQAYKLGMISEKLYEKFVQEKEFIERGIALVRERGNQSKLFKLFHAFDFTPEIKAQAQELLLNLFEERNLATTGFSGRAILCIHADIRYSGYIEKEIQEVAKIARYQELVLPAQLDYSKLDGISIELQEKLAHFKPQTIAQAQLIPGMTPAAISVLIFQTKSLEKKS